MNNVTYTPELICLGDGFAHGHIWPEWPQIMAALFPEYKLTLISAVGAGHEYLVDSLLCLGSKIKNQTVIFQWPAPIRFDKLLQDDQWDTMINSSIYGVNIYENEHGRWWVSGSNDDPKIKEYHNFYVQQPQALLRWKNQKILVENYLQNNNCRYFFTSTNEQDIYSRQSQIVNIREWEVQPSPMSHLCWVIDVVCPGIGLTPDSRRLTLLTNRIAAHKWIPYDPDRSSIWEDIIQLD